MLTFHGSTQIDIQKCPLLRLNAAYTARLTENSFFGTRSGAVFDFRAMCALAAFGAYSLQKPFKSHRSPSTLSKDLDLGLLYPQTAKKVNHYFWIHGKVRRILHFSMFCAILYLI